VLESKEFDDTWHYEARTETNRTSKCTRQNHRNICKSTNIIAPQFHSIYKIPLEHRLTNIILIQATEQWLSMIAYQAKVITQHDFRYLL